MESVLMTLWYALFVFLSSNISHHHHLMIIITTCIASAVTIYHISAHNSAYITHHNHLYHINRHNLSLPCTQQRLYRIFTLCRWMEYAIAKLPPSKSRVTILIDRVGTVDVDLITHLVSSSHR